MMRHVNGAKEIKGAYNSMIMRYAGLHGASQTERQTNSQIARPTTEYDNEMCT
jgi:hypothetical protein